MDEGMTVDNVNINNEEKIKQKKKDKKSKKRAMAAEEAHNVDTMKPAESDRISEKEYISEAKRDHKSIKEKKKKTKKTKGADDEADMKNGSRKAELTAVHGESSSGLTIDNAERKSKRIERKDKKSKRRAMAAEEAHNVDTMKPAESDRISENEYISEAKRDHKSIKEKKKKKKKTKKVKGADDEADMKNGSRKAELTGVHGESSSGLTIDNAEKKSKRIERKDKKEKSKMQDTEDNEAEYANKGKKRKNGLVVNGSDDTSPNKSSKKVRFSDHDEVFTIPTNSNNEKANGEVGDDLVRGKRFTKEEDKMVKDAVLRYIEEKDLGDEGLEMVLNCRKHSNLKGCWKEIGSGIPNRPYRAVYYRARILFMRSESRKWTQEELNMVLEYQQKNGNQWRPLADELGKHTWHVKDAWRRIKLPDRKKGNWSQQEYQRLFDLVNTDLQLKLSEEKKSKHGMLRDNICWTAISDTLSTRAQAACCLKWYKQLTSAMVAEGVWADSDDFRLLCALYSLDATCLEDVDWDDLIDNRPGEVCLKRWNQMVLHLGDNRNKSFAEQVEVLAKRYCPHLLEARVIWENKPRVP